MKRYITACLVLITMASATYAQDATKGKKAEKKHEKMEMKKSKGKMKKESKKEVKMDKKEMKSK